MYKVDIENKKLIELTPINFGDLKLTEPYDIEDWIEKTPKVLGEELLIITRQYFVPSGKKLDLLAIDKKANLVIIELKRDNSGSEVEWQAIKYASYCANFLADDIFEIFAAYIKDDQIEAQSRIEEFIEVDLENLNDSQRIILVSKEFHSDVISAVLWLRDFEINIECIRLKPFLTPDRQLIISPELIIPLPEAKDYITRKEKKEKEHKQNIRSTFSLEIGNLEIDELKIKIKETLKRPSDLTPRVIAFFEILLSENKSFNREEIKAGLLKRNIGKDIGQSGRYLSNISQFFTKKSNPHLRQVVSFETGGGFGEKKENYKIIEEYREILNQIMNELKNDEDTTHNIV
jgi:hypothetical protein